MAQTALDFTFARRPSPAELGLSPGSHARLIYEWLLQKEITNAEIVRVIGCFNSTGRISDLRAKLKPHLLYIEPRRVEKGLWEYRLRG